MTHIFKMNPDEHGGKREGAGRPKGPEKVRISAKVLPETKKRLQSKAKEQNSTIGEVIDDAMKP